MHAILHDHPFLKKHAAKIKGVLSCFDRVIFRGYLPICHPRGLAGWMWSRGVKPSAFKTFAPGIAERLVQHAKDTAAKAGRLYQHHPSRLEKEELARQIAKRDHIKDGLVCVFSCLETCRTFRLKYGPGRSELKADLRRCTVLYYFFMDKECGLIHIKMHTWLPLTCQVYVNGHSWLERQLDQRGLGYEAADNALIGLDNVAATQKLADSFLRLNWRKRLDAWARLVNPLLGDDLAGNKGPFEYWWVTDQAEYSTDILFASRQALAELQPALMGHATSCFSSLDVLRFFGRKMHPCFKLDVRTEKKPYVKEDKSDVDAGRGVASPGRVDGVRVRHQVGSNKLKMYDKQGLVLRIETVINDPRQFKVRRRPGPSGRPRVGESETYKHGQPAWLPLRKSVAWLWKYAEVSFATNRRYLEALALVDDPSLARKLLDRASRPQTFGRRRRRALQPISPQDQALFLAVLRGEHHLHGLSNRDLDRELHGASPTEARERRRRGARVTRLIQLLRAHGILKKIPGQRRYRITRQGLQLMGAAIYVRHKHLPKLIVDATVEAA